MDKITFETPDLVAGNIEKIAALFPNCITEALDEARSTAEKKVYKKVVNFEVLKQMLSGEVLEGDEAYQFTWVGKKAAMVEANRPIRKTLLPCPEESKDWDTTQNLYIEGDNLEVLKLLQESYLGAVKMIYIDPPYNTGNDFIYRDDFAMDTDEYEHQLGMYDEETGERLFRNTDSNGRFHSDWCSMIYSRLLLARNLLTEDGVIFISIDDNEQDDLKKMCDEVFGAANFIENLIWKKMYGGKIDSKWFARYHDYIIVYAKNKEFWHPNLLPRGEEAKARYKNPDNDPRGPWKAADFTGAGSTSTTYSITSPAGKIFVPPTGKHWVASKENCEKLMNEGRLWFGKNGDSFPAIKRFLSEIKEGVPQTSLLDYSEVGHSDEANRQLKDLMGCVCFDYPKPVRLLHRLLYLGTSKDDIIIDFFSGSATTAHAVMQLNAEDGGHRKFIMVQLPEKCDESSEAYKAGYKTICEIGKERIRRAGEKIKAEKFGNTEEYDNSSLLIPNSSFDIGFRVFRVASPNTNDVYLPASSYDQTMLVGMESNLRDDRTDLDLLFGCLLDWGLPLSLPYASEIIDGCTVHTYNDGDLIACFDASVPESVIETIAKRQPLRAVFRDSSFSTSPAKINVTEIFKYYAPDTRVKVL